MNTFVALGLDSFNKRLKEIDLLISEAEKNKSNSEVYDSICRSLQVFIVSHFEGSIKDFTRNILEDINYHSSFKNTKEPIKRSFCEYYMKRDKSNYPEQIRIKLISTFDQLPIELFSEPFLSENNKNPSPNMISSVTKKFGVEHFFSRLKGSDLEIIFEDMKTEMLELRDSLKAHLAKETENYPYSVKPLKYKILETDNGRFNVNIWTTFIDDFLQKRHEIAHGNTLLNSMNHNQLETLKVKIEILIYGLYLTLCKAVV